MRKSLYITFALLTMLLISCSKSNEPTENENGNKNGIELFDYEYDSFIGTSREKIYGTFGNETYQDTEESIFYALGEEGNFKYMEIKFDLITELVKSIELVVNDKTNITNDIIISSLKKKYSTYTNGTTDKISAFLNKPKFDDATVGINWIADDKLISFEAINHDLFADYSPLLRKSNSKIRFMLKSLSLKTSTKECLIYNVSNDKYISSITVNFNSADNANEVLTQLKTGVDKSVINNYLNNKYTFIMSDTNDSIEPTSYYQNSDKSIIVIFDVDDNCIIYMPAEDC